MNSQRRNIPGIKIAFYIVILTEIMFFAGIISAYVIAASKATDWPPIEQPRLPLWLSVANVFILLSSAFTMNIFSKNAQYGNLKNKRLLITIILGLIFLVIQGFEWINLVNFGIQNSTGLYASYFYTIIALHGFHVLIGISLITGLFFVLKNKGGVGDNYPMISAFAMFWFFVAFLWPILYFLLYHL